jgi:predicted nucleotidyltransferase
MTKFLPGFTREDLRDVDDPDEGVRVAREAARRLRAAYDERLVEVVLFGSWVRGEAHEESDVDLLVVLDDVVDRARERRQIIDVLYDLEVDSARAIEGFPVAQRDFVARARPIVRTARDEGLTVMGGDTDEAAG